MSEEVLYLYEFLVKAYPPDTAPLVRSLPANSPTVEVWARNPEEAIGEVYRVFPECPNQVIKWALVSIHPVNNWQTI